MSTRWWDGGLGAARVWLGVALAFAVASGGAALVLRAELDSPGLQVVSRGGYDRVTTAHSTLALMAATAAFFGLAHLALATSNVAPGPGEESSGWRRWPARAAAAPGPGEESSRWRRWPARAAVAGAVVFVVGGVLVAIGLLRGGTTSFGWFAYAPLPDRAPASPGVRPVHLGLVVSGIAVVASSLMIVLEVLGRRRNPTSWFVLAAAVLIAARALLTLGDPLPDPGRLDELALALPFLALIVDGLLSGGPLSGGLARWWAGAGLVSAVAGLVVHRWTAKPDSASEVALDHSVAFGLVVFGLFTGLYRWWPALTGYALDDRLGRVHLALFFAGYQITFGAMAWLGREGMPRRYADYLPQDGFTGTQRLATAGALLLAVSLLPFALAARPPRWGRREAAAPATRSGPDAP